jgi:K+-transporting ATPase KdpF subunit
MGGLHARARLEEFMSPMLLAAALLALALLGYLVFALLKPEKFQ